MRKETINVSGLIPRTEILQMSCVSNSQPWPIGADEGSWTASRPDHPADLMHEGKYPGKQESPAVPGFEGSGIVSSLERTLAKLTIGFPLVILPHDLGTWR